MLKKPSAPESPCHNVKVVDCGQNQFIILNDKPIGQGASAVVKLAVNKSTSQQYAVKIIHIANKQCRDIALKQLQIAQSLEPNPNLVHIQKIKVESANNIYIFMEYCNGGTLIDEMKKKHSYFREEEIYTIFCHLINGYKVLVDAKVLHQDIKPENVLIKDGVYKISDFGLAIFSENYKYPSKRKGTLYYMAFEKITRKEYTANVKSDIYSMGVMLYEIITGRHPYIEKRGLDIKEFARELKDARLRHQNITDRYSFKFMVLFSIVEKMVAKSEEKRISWEELYEFYINFQPLEQFKQIRPMQTAQQSPFKNAIYNQIGRSNATIQGLQLEISERENIPIDKSTEVKEKGQDEELKIQLTNRRNYAYFLKKVLQSMEGYLVSNKEETIEKLLLALYMYRPKIIPPLEEYDIYEKNTSAAEVLLVYQSDSKFVKQQQICQLGETSLPQAIKKDLINKFKSTLPQIQSYICDLIRSLFTSLFIVIRINFKKEVAMLLYLLSLRKILEKQLPKSQQTYDKVYHLQEGDSISISKYIEAEFNLMVIYDPEVDEKSEEFEVLDWTDFLKNQDSGKEKKTAPE